MGMNFSAIAISKPVKDSNTLARGLGIKLEYEGESTFEMAQSDKSQEYLYFLKTGKGTLGIMPLNEFDIARASADCRIASFHLSDTAMAFALFAAQNGQLVRFYNELNNEVLDDQGKALPCEADTDDFYEKMVPFHGVQWQRLLGTRTQRNDAEVQALATSMMKSRKHLRLLRLPRFRHKRKSMKTGLLLRSVNYCGRERKQAGNYCWSAVFPVHCNCCGIRVPACHYLERFFSGCCSAFRSFNSLPEMGKGV